MVAAADHVKRVKQIVPAVDPLAVEKKAPAVLDGLAEAPKFEVAAPGREKVAVHSPKIRRKTAKAQPSGTRETGSRSRVTNAILDGTYEALESGPLNVTAGEREVVAAMRRIPGDDTRRVRVARAVVEFLDLYLDGVRRADAQNNGTAHV